MHKSHSHQSEKRSEYGHTMLITVVIACVAALVLYLHNISLWYIPLGVIGLMIVHLALAGGVAVWIKRTRKGTSGESGGITLHNPRLYDLEARICTVGQESRLRQWTLDLADLRPGNKVLDVGCGTGTLLLASAERVGTAGELHGVEPSAEM